MKKFLIIFLIFAFCLTASSCVDPGGLPTHTLKEKVIWEATCKHEGYVDIYCEDCDENFDSKHVPVVPCEKDKNGKCKWCGYTAKDLISWINTLKVEDITQVRINRTSSIPGILGKINTSTALIDKTKVVDYLKNLGLVKLTRPVKMDWSPIYLTIQTSDQTYELKYIDGLVIGQDRYETNIGIPTLTQAQTSHQFSLIEAALSVLYYDGERVNKSYESYLRQIEFIETNDTYDISQTKLVLQTANLATKLYLIDSKTFACDVRRDSGVYTIYKLVGDVDFTEIFADFPIE